MRSLRNAPRQAKDLCKNLTHSCGQPVQFVILDAQFVKMCRRVEQILGVGAAPADGMGDDLRLLFQRQAPAILHVIGIYDVGDGLDPAAIAQADHLMRFQIGRGHQLAFAQLGQHVLFLPRTHG